MNSSSKELKNLQLLGKFLLKNFSKLSKYSYGYTPLCFSNFYNTYFYITFTYLKPVFDKFLTNASTLELINCMLSIQTKFLLIVKAMCFSNPFGVIPTFTSNLPIFCMIKWLSEPLKL